MATRSGALWGLRTSGFWVWSEPCSMSRTRGDATAWLSLEARTHPAVPPPTMMKSNVVSMSIASISQVM